MNAAPIPAAATAAAALREPAADTDLQAWTASLVRAIDAKDVDGFLGFLAPNASFAFANFPPATGTAAIRAALETFFAGVKSLTHTVDHAWNVPGYRVMRGCVEYVRLDGGRVVLGFCNVLGMSGARVADYRIYIDPAPLLAP